MTEPNDDLAARELVLAAYEAVLKRRPAAGELAHWTTIAKTITPTQLIRRFAASAEALAKDGVHPFFPNGHYHSPIVDPSLVADYVASRRHPGVSGFPGVNVDIQRMVELWDATKDAMASIAFPEQKRDDFRFHFTGSPFPYGDALSLHAILGHYRPARIVEIGSGFSTACMLDSADVHGLTNLAITCIEPYPDRLNSLLRPADASRVKLLAKGVQEVPVADIVGALMPNDILFIDSTHVLKTGSDVHYELFELIPAVRPGVIIHVHDCPYPFEYPDPWIEQSYSWNEVYAMRAFFMYNHQFEIIFWGSLFRRLFADKVRREGGVFEKNPGTSLWFKRVA